MRTRPDGARGAAIETRLGEASRIWTPGAGARILLAVPAGRVGRPSLGALEEEPAIEGYVTGLGGNERRAVGMYLDGKSARVIARDAEIVRGGAGLQDVRVWVYGSGERFGLLSAMYGVMMRKAEFCPFCHGGRSTGKGYMVRLHGSVCPHREIWEGERRRERGRG